MTERSRRAGLTAALTSAALLLTTPLAAMAQEDIDTFTYAPHLAVVTDLDPATSYSNENTAMHNVYESLTRYDSAAGEVKPALATEWSASEDGLTWTFTLRDDVTFHTGNPMDAEAVDRRARANSRPGPGRRLHLGRCRVLRGARCHDPGDEPRRARADGPHRRRQLRGVRLRRGCCRSRRLRGGPGGLLRRGWRRGHRALHHLDVGAGRRVRADARCLPRVLGRLGRRALRRGRLPRRPRGHDRDAAGQGRRGPDGGAADPAAHR